MAILRASNVNHRGATLPKFCRTSTTVFVEHSAGCCAILLKKNADWNLHKWWRRKARRPTEIYRKNKGEKHDGRRKTSACRAKIYAAWWPARTERRQTPDGTGMHGMPDGKRLTGDIKEERPSVTGKPPLYITLNCDCPILINKTIYGKTKSCKSKLKRQ